MGCDYTTGAAIEVCASFGNSPRVSALFEAELSECSMGGNLCGTNTGEALSRWCAAVISSNALSDFSTAPQWAQDGMPNYVDHTDPTDQNADSTGCGMAFLSWVMSQGHGLDAIAQAMVSLGDSGTLAAQPGQLGHLPPWTVALAGKVFEAILADILANKSANQIVASVRAVLATAPAAKQTVLSAAACSIGSRRLLPPHKAQAHSAGR
jgi:hypothetical protein